MHEDPQGRRSAAVAAREMKQLLAEISAKVGAGNMAVVGHGGVIHKATGIALSEGEIAVLRPDADGAFALIDRFRGSDLDHFARQAIEKGN